MKYTPYIYQTKSLEWMLEHPKCGLFLDMGLGKTVVALTGIRLLKGLFVGKTLVIAPKRVCELVWRQEASEWDHLRDLRFSAVIGSAGQRRKALATDADVYLINRENVAWLCAEYGGNYLPFDMVIIDESSSFKNHTSMRFKALARAIIDVPRVVLLTGTPAPRGYINLWSQIYLLDQGKRLGKFITHFRSKYFRPDWSGFSYNIVGGADKRIEELIGDICISFQAKDWLDLPELIEVDDFVDLSPETQQLYDDFERDQILEFIESGVEVTALSAAVLCNKLLQLSNGAMYYNDKHAYQVVHDEKIAKLIEIIEEANGASVLVAYQFQHDKERLFGALKPYSPRLLKTDKDKEDWDAGRIQVLLGHPASMGHGLNMQKGGNIAVWFGPTWDLELYQQFNARLHRNGQKWPVFLHHIIGRSTEDQRVMHVLKKKGDAQQALKDSLSAKIAKWKKYAGN